MRTFGQNKTERDLVKAELVALSEELDVLFINGKPRLNMTVTEPKNELLKFEKFRLKKSQQEDQKAAAPRSKYPTGGFFKPGSAGTPEPKKELSKFEKFRLKKKQQDGINPTDTPSTKQPTTRFGKLKTNPEAGAEPKKELSKFEKFRLKKSQQTDEEPKKISGFRLKKKDQETGTPKAKYPTGGFFKPKTQKPDTPAPKKELSAFEKFRLKQKQKEEGNKGVDTPKKPETDASPATTKEMSPFEKLRLKKKQKEEGTTTPTAKYPTGGFFKPKTTPEKSAPDSSEPKKELSAFEKFRLKKKQKEEGTTPNTDEPKKVSPFQKFRLKKSEEDSTPSAPKAKYPTGGFFKPKATPEKPADTPAPKKELSAFEKFRLKKKQKEEGTTPTTPKAKYPTGGFFKPKTTPEKAAPDTTEPKKELSAFEKFRLKKKQQEEGNKGVDTPKPETDASPATTKEMSPFEKFRLKKKQKEEGTTTPKAKYPTGGFFKPKTTPEKSADSSEPKKELSAFEKFRLKKKQYQEGTSPATPKAKYPTGGFLKPKPTPENPATETTNPEKELSAFEKFRLKKKQKEEVNVGVDAPNAQGTEPKKEVSAFQKFRLQKNSEEVNPPATPKATYPTGGFFNPNKKPSSDVGTPDTANEVLSPFEKFRLKKKDKEEPNKQSNGPQEPKKMSAFEKFRLQKQQKSQQVETSNNEESRDKPTSDGEGKKLSAFEKFRLKKKQQQEGLAAPKSTYPTGGFFNPKKSSSEEAGGEPKKELSSFEKFRLRKKQQQEANGTTPKVNRFAPRTQPQESTEQGEKKMSAFERYRLKKKQEQEGQSGNNPF